MPKIWTKKEEKLLLDFVKEGLTTEEIAQTLGRSYKSISHRRADLTRIITPERASRIIEEEKTININDVGKTIIDTLREKLSRIAPTVEKPILSTQLNKVGDTLVVHFTDWHVGRIVKDEHGKEIYNTEVFKKRIKLLLTEILLLLDGYIRKGTPIKDVAIISTGDILDGMGIYASQETQSEMSPPFQVMLAVNVIRGFISALIKRKLIVTFYGVKGNHGEIREHGKSRDPNANWDLMLYLVLDLWYKNMLKNNKVNIQYSELDYLNFEIQGWKYHIRHITPKQSETAAGKAKFLGWARTHNCDVIVSGHYHHYSISDRSGITVFHGGSIPGADEFSESLAEDSRPIQLIWGVSKNRPMTFAYAIDLGNRKRN